MKHNVMGFLILASLCWVSSPGLAKGPGGGGGHGGGGHGGGGHGGGPGRGYYHRGYYGGFYGIPYGYPGFYGYDPGFYGYGVPGYYPYPLPAYPVPVPGIMVPGDGASGSFFPPNFPPSPTVERALPVTFALKVPANAEVWFNGAKTTQTGVVRQFQSPPVESGSNYEYEIRVSWQESGQPITQTRHVSVRAGQNVNLEFKARIAPGQP